MMERNREEAQRAEVVRVMKLVGRVNVRRLLETREFDQTLGQPVFLSRIPLNQSIDQNPLRFLAAGVSIVSLSARIKIILGGRIWLAQLFPPPFILYK